MVRIHGRSGVGKSSIFKAISYAFYGKQNKITTWNEETTSVQFDGFDLSITRGRGPNILKVNGLSSSTAQNEIENILRMNKTEFDICSYVAQNQKNSLINLSPSEQMELINELAFKGSDPFKQKEEIAEKTKEVGNLLSQLENKEQSTQDKIKDIKNTISSLSETMFDVQGTPKDLQKKIATSEGQIHALNRKIDELKKARDEFNENKNHPARNVFQSASDFLCKYQESLDELTAKQAEYKEKLHDFKEDYVGKQINEYVEQAKKLKQELNKMEWLLSQMQNLERYQEQKQLSLSKIFNLTQNIELYGEPEIIDKILDLKIICEEFLGHHDAIESISVTNFESEINTKITKHKKNIQKFELAADQLSEHLKEMRKHKVLLDDVENNILTLQKKKQKADQIISTNANLIPISELEGKIQSVFMEIETHSTELNKEISKKNALQGKLDQINKNVEIRNKINEYEQRLNTLSESLAEIAKQKQEAKELYSGCSEIGEVWQKSMLESLESIIDEINFRATYWLDLLLDGRVKAELKTTRKLKSKDKEISAINLELTCDGQILDTLNEDDLSGGQFSRLVLAFQLALSDMYNSPILMLDESLQGCDLATQEICISAIKEISDRKLVLMIEHHTQDYFFDEVIYIE
jgi:DNA repair exonuclease SbcCD ATPase subunit